MPDRPSNLIESATHLRKLALDWERWVLDLKSHGDLKALEGSSIANVPEAIANIMLAYRHIEDARMRLGKVIQAMDGGTSIYDKSKQ